MGKDERHRLRRRKDDTFYDVIIIGNGPSAIFLSRILTGNWPYYVGRGASEDLHMRLRENPKLSLVEQDLEFLAQDLEGRSPNQVSLLFDYLHRPGADLNLELPSLLRWEANPELAVNILVLGKGPPGGIWQAMPSDVLTLSSAPWMEIPGRTLKEWAREKGHQLAQVEGRAQSSDLAQYYQDYVESKGLEGHFKNYLTVNYLRPTRPTAGWAMSRLASKQMRSLGGQEQERGMAQSSGKGTDNKIGDVTYNADRLISQDDFSCFDENICRLSSSLDTACELCRIGKALANSGKRHNVTSYKEPSADSNTLVKSFHQKPRWLVCAKDSSGTKHTYLAHSVVLATGAGCARRLGIPGEDLPFVFHTAQRVAVALANGNITSNSLPLLVVGAGLSAADAILSAINHNVSVVHAFRRAANDPNLIFSQLPSNMYREYHEVHDMMRNPQSYKRGYRPLQRHRLTAIYPDQKVELQGPDGPTEMKVSAIAILIGTEVDLSFLPKNGLGLANNPDMRLHSRYNNLQADPITMRLTKAPPGLYAIGALVGDSLVRFSQGNALSVASDLIKERLSPSD